MPGFAGPHRRRPRQCARLHVEELETRNVPSALTPIQVRHAYGFDPVAFRSNGQTIPADGRGQTIAIVDAFNSPSIFNDLDAFDRAYTIDGVHTLYQQYGPSSSVLTRATPQGTPKNDVNWSLEVALDVEWAHAIAPAAHILLVEATSTNSNDLLAAIDYARRQPGVVAVSMSWSGPEFDGETNVDSYFTTPASHLGGSNGLGGAALPGGVTFVAASGDNGTPAMWPGVSPQVLAVGGTTLSIDSSGNYLGETAWSASTGGASAYEPEPSYQSRAQHTGTRSTPDVSYDGDPATGFSVYEQGWWKVGGTSAGAPQWAALVALVDQGRAMAGAGSLDGATQTVPGLYNLPSTDYHDVTSGNNGAAARAGYDFVTGMGSPYANRIIAHLLGVSTGGVLGTSATRTVVPAKTTVSAAFQVSSSERVPMLSQQSDSGPPATAQSAVRDAVRPPAGVWMIAPIGLIPPTTACQGGALARTKLAQPTQIAWFAPGTAAARDTMNRGNSERDVPQAMEAPADTKPTAQSKPSPAISCTIARVDSSEERPVENEEECSSTDNSPAPHGSATELPGADLMAPLVFVFILSSFASPPVQHEQTQSRPFSPPAE